MLVRYPGHTTKLDRHMLLALLQSTKVCRQRLVKLLTIQVLDFRISHGIEHMRRSECQLMHVIRRLPMSVS